MSRVDQLKRKFIKKRWHARTIATALIAGTALFVSNAALAVLPFEVTGNLYVSMWDADEIAVFSPSGVPIERFSAEGLDGPRGIAFNPANGEVWVAGEFSNAIYIFDHKHQLLRKLEHPDFSEPVGVTFTSTAGIAAMDQSVYISNSNGNELMVFSQAGTLLKRFTGSTLLDPNCSAFMDDGSLFVANRLGGTADNKGAVSKFDTNDNFLFDFSTPGIISVMAVARDPNAMPSGIDDTLWATSGGGDTGIYEFDQNGNLLTTLLPTDIDDGRPIVPQGIAFDGSGDFYVVSYQNEVIKFDSDGNYLMRFPTGSGTGRSTAFQGCRTDVDMSQTCVPLGTDGASDVTNNPESTSSSGGGASNYVLLAFCFFIGLIRRARPGNLQYCN